MGAAPSQLVALRAVCHEPTGPRAPEDGFGETCPGHGEPRKRRAVQQLEEG